MERSIARELHDGQPHQVGQYGRGSRVVGSWLWLKEALGSNADSVYVQCPDLITLGSGFTMGTCKLRGYVVK